MSSVLTPAGQADATAVMVAQVQALRRVALAVAHPGGQRLFDHLVAELADAMRVSVVFVATFADDAQTVLRTLAARLDGRALRDFDYPLEGSPCAQVVGRAFRFVASGVAGEFRPGTLFAAKAMDSYAAYPLTDSSGAALGLLVAMDRRPIADGDSAHAEAMLKIVAGRLAAEMERTRTDEILRSAALAVSGARSGTVFDELVRLLAAILHVEIAFVARQQPEDPDGLRMLAMVCDGQIVRDVRYPIVGTPCETVLGQQFRAYPQQLQELFPDDHDARVQCAESYAGFPLVALDGAPLGVLSVASRRVLTQPDRIESMLKIFAVRAAAEVERLQAREELERSEASYRTIFDVAEDAIFIHDWDSGDILDVNPKACETYGFSYEELLRLSLAAISSGVAPFTAENALLHIEQAKLGRCPPFEWRTRKKDGSLHWDEVRLKPATIGGRPRILAFARDITAQKNAMAALQTREEQYRAIFDGSSDAMGLWDRELRLVDVNSVFTRISGYTRDQAIGHRLLDRPGEPEVERRSELLRAALAGREGRIELQVPARSGTTMDVEVSYVPVRFGGESYALSIARDITERRERERALQRSEARLRATVEAAFDCVIGMDGVGRVVEFNAAAERVFGHRRQDVLGRLLADVILPERHRDAHARGLRYYHASGHGRMVGRLVETTALCADGREIPVEMAISVASVPEGNIFVGHLRDISARRAAESERAALEAQLRQAQKMEAIGQLTGGIAHDFNNILTSVIGYVAMGQERAEAAGDATVVRQLGQAQLAAQRARDLIGQMLAFARRQRGERRVVLLEPLVRQTLQLLRATLPSSVVLDAAPLSDGADLQVEADAVQLEQVLFNLCINARDAIQGPGTIRVRLRDDRGGWSCASCRARVDGGQWIALRVADSGNGISPDAIERMFEPFFSTKEVGRGSGMGLAMVHGIVHDHGGHIDVRTRPGRGSVFRVLLPPAATPAGPPVPSAGAMLPSPAGRVPGGRVLVVEDEVMVGDLMVEMLGGWGLQVVLHRDPVQAAAWLDDPAHAVDLLITDHTMPRMTGLVLAQHALSTRPGLPVLLYTGNADGVETAEWQRVGVRVVLRKPLDVHALRVQLQRLLGERGSVAAD